VQVYNFAGKYTSRILIKRGKLLFLPFVVPDGEISCFLPEHWDAVLRFIFAEAQMKKWIMTDCFKLTPC
jgi:hypothetical protein